MNDIGMLTYLAKSLGSELNPIHIPIVGEVGLYQIGNHRYGDGLHDHFDDRLIRSTFLH